MGQGQRTSAAPLAPSCWRKWRACASSLRRGMQQSRGRETVPCGVLRAHGWHQLGGTRGCEHSAGHDGDGMVPSACALECLLTQGPCLPRIWGGEPQANHHPRRQEEDSQPREGQVVVARQGKGETARGPLGGYTPPPPLASHVVGELRHQRRPFADAQRAAKLPRPAALFAAAAPRRCGRRRLRSVGVDLRQRAQPACRKQRA